MFKRLGIALLLCACPLLAQADGLAPYEEYATHLRAAQEVTPLTSSEFGDQVSLYNRSTEFDIVDIDVPGNNALPVQLRRRFEVSDHRAQGGYLGGFGEWDLDVPYLEGVFSQQFGWVVGTIDGYGYNRCSQPGPPFTGLGVQDGGVYASADIVWDGYQMHMPGHGYQDLLVNTQPLPGVTDGKTYPWITKDYTRLTCLPAPTQNDPGEGFLAVSADGTKTYFNRIVTLGYPSVLVDESRAPEIFGGGKSTNTFAPRSKVIMLATRVEDRFGNWVDYNWGPDSAGNTILTSITSSDGRKITPTWTNGEITGATSNVGNWSYGYVTPPVGTGYAGHPSLQKVTRPDKSTWTYAFTGSLSSTRPPLTPPSDDWPPAIHCQLDPEDIPAGTYTYTVNAPFGASATYQFNNERDHHSYVPLSCNDGQNDHYYPQVYDFFDNYTLDSKTVSGPGLATQTWTYAYAPSGQIGNNYFTASVSGLTVPGPWDSQVYVPQGDCSTCSLSKQLVVTGPTEITKYTFGMQYARNEGRLLATEVDGLDGTVLRTTTNTFVADADVPNLPFPSYAGDNLSAVYKNPMANWIRPQSQTAIVQDGVTFTNQTNAWDVFARPTSATRSSTLGYSKTETTAYADNTNIWVIGQLGSVTDSTSAKPEVQNLYDPTWATLTSTASFGVLEKANTWYTLDDPYHEAGALKSVTDGDGNTTTLSEWTRGVPQSVAYADGTTESARVNDSGWITLYTDENGYTTGYGYDAMGRVDQVTWPIGDSVAWTPTTSSFVQMNTVEYGLPAGHWRHVVSTGAARKTVYYDALLRPVLQREEDTSNAATIRYTEQAFDAANRTLFASYPSATASAYNDLTLGTRTSFDGLGRPLISSQDSELVSPSRLVTKYAYLSNFMTQVTNPRSQVTTTAYQAFDSPDTSHPTAIASPMGVTTTIARDVFGKPLGILRSGTSNSQSSGTPVSETRSYLYDATDQRLCERIEPETGATLMNYDAADNVLWTAPGSTPTASCNSANVAAPANAIVRSYDQRNRPRTESVPGSTAIGWQYYPDGELQTLTSGTNTWSYTYDMRRLPVTENLVIDGRTETITHGYDVRGHENSLTWPDGLVINTAPNALGQPTQAGTQPTPYVAGVSYFPNGAMSGFSYGNGIVHTLTQNTRGLPLESLDQLPGSPAILDDTYTYDANGNVTAIADGTVGNANGRTMSYDALDRLKGTSAPGQPWVSASTTYDGLDNIRSNTVGTRTYNYAYDGTWRLSQINQPGSGVVMTLGYDANGNVASKGNGHDSYTFDVANRMQSVVGKESYQYDGYGRRVKITRLTDGKIDYPIYDMTGRLLTEDDQRSNTTTDYVSLNGSLVGKRTATIGGTVWAKSYEHTDALRSPISVTNASGAVVSSERYTPYGEPSDGTYSQGPGYTGHVTDAATGLTYAQQRYYDPVCGCFLSPDSNPVDTTTAFNFNRYNYAGDNPYKFTDPDGRAFGVDDIVGSAVGGLVGMGVEAIKDVATDEPITKGDLAGAFVGGALMGEGIVNAPETLGGSVVAAGAARGAAVALVSNTVQQGTDIATGTQKNYSVTSAVVSTAVGAATGGILTKVPTVKVPGVTTGRNSMAAVAKAVKTRIANGNASNMSAKTIAKGVIGGQVGSAGKTAVGGAIDATQAKVCGTDGC